MSWTPPSCNQKIHPPGTSTGTPLGHRRPAPALALLPRGGRSGHLPTNPVLAVKRRYASLNSSTTRRSHPHAVHCSLRSIKKELVAFSMSSKLATSVTVVADQPCRGVPPRLLHVPCCYVPAVIRSLKGGQEIRKTGGLSKHSLSPRPGRQCDAPATTTWTLRTVRALAAVPWGPPAAVPGPQGHHAFLLDSRKRPSPDTPADTSPLRASAGFVPTSLRRLLHRQLRLIIRHQRPYLCLCCVLSWQKLKFNCRPACLDPLASDAFQLFRPASRRAGT